MRVPTVLSGLPTDERPGRPAARDLLDHRAAAAGMTAEAGADVTVTDTAIGGVPCRVVAVGDPTVPPRATVLYLHGGGYRLGTAAEFTGLAAKLATAANASVVAVDYRLAPEHPFPAALRDAAAVYDALHVEAALPVVVAGDSAGGGLGAALVGAALSVGAALPIGVVLMSPWLDLRCTSPTFASRARTDLLFPQASARKAAQQYLQGHPADDALVSPLLAAGPGFPPVLVFASTEETLLGDAVALTCRLAEAGTEVTLDVVAGTVHAWPMVTPDRPESDAALARVGAFVRKHASREEESWRRSRSARSAR